MPINVKCSNPACGQTLRAKDEHAGRQGKYPACGSIMAIPLSENTTVVRDDNMMRYLGKTEPTAPTGQSRIIEDYDIRVCPFCAETIKAAAIKCRFCGSILESTQLPNVTPIATNLSSIKGSFICPNPKCSYVGEPSREPKGSSMMALLLLCLGLIPGLLYCVFASGYRYKCPKCGLVLRTDIVR